MPGRGEGINGRTFRSPNPGKPKENIMINRTKKAFTLLELIVVLLVLGILAAIAVPTFNTVKANSAKRSAQTTAEGIARNADAIAASSASGAAVSIGDLDKAIGEADVENILDSWEGDMDGTYTGTDRAYKTEISGNSVTCTFVLGSATAATSVTCA
jgi:prepilin-type N-terminal cleavage/methylation domain-containing protein